MLNVAFICSINQEKLHVLYLIGMQNNSVLLLVTWEQKIIWMDTVVTVETYM